MASSAIAAPAQAHLPRPAGPGVSAAARDTLPGLQSNDVGLLVPVGGLVWVSGGRTLSRMRVERDGRTQFDWLTVEVKTESTLKEEAISAFAVNGQRIAVATTYNVRLTQGTFPVGTGLYLSSDSGAHWSLRTMPQIFLDRSDMAVPGGQAQCFGLAFVGQQLWATFETEFVVMTPDFGTTWLRYRPDSTNNPQPNPFLDPIVIYPSTPPDTIQRVYRYTHLNYRAFDVAALGPSLWVSTNAGINRSLDGGVTWTNFDAATAGISGDFVPALYADTTNGIIWAATQSTGIDEADVRNSQYPIDYFRDGKLDSRDWDLDRDGHDDPSGRNGVSWTADGGTTWKSYLPADDPAVRRDVRAWAFAVNGQSVWVAGSTGGNDALLRSDDLGTTWRLQPIVTTAGDTVASEQGVTDVAYVSGVLWVTTARGLLRSQDDGATWEFVLRYPQTEPLGGGDVLVPEGPKAEELTTYAFPSPSAPRLGRPPVIVFALSSATDVTIELYDVAGGLVRTIRRPGLERGNHTVDWNGRSEDGRDVANGVYLYRVRTADGHTATGKLMVSN